MSKSSYKQCKICEYTKQHLKVKHGEMAKPFNKKFNLSIDCLTVSKILTKKEKWLDLPPSKQYQG